MTPDKSLILAAESRRLDTPAFSFFSENLETLEQHGDFTGERLFGQHPDRYQAIVELIAECTIPDTYIAKLAKVSRNTINAVRDREKIPIERIKESILRNVRTGLRMVTERVIELAPTMNAKESVIALGILAEKHQLLSGEATSIIGTTAGDKLQHASFNDLIDQLPAADAEVIEMGSSSGEAGQKGGVESSGFVGSGDCESSALPSDDGRSNGQSNISSQPSEGQQQGGRGAAEGEGVNNPN